MLDDANVLRQRDSKDALGYVAEAYQQLLAPAELQQSNHDGRTLDAVVIAGVGTSGLAADMVCAAVAPVVPVPVIALHDTELPQFVGPQTLLIVVSTSGDTPEMQQCMQQALSLHHQPQIAVVAGGGVLQRVAVEHDMLFATVQQGMGARFSLLGLMKQILAVLAAFQVPVQPVLDELMTSAEWLHGETAFWEKAVPTAQNYAKQLALIAVGKTPVIYTGPRLAPVASKWKASFNQQAKNVVFAGTYPEAAHADMLGWRSHPVEKPFAVFDLWSNLEPELVQEQFKLSDQHLSGKRPKATVVAVQGETLVRQLLWGSVLADFVALYVAILNGVSPTKV